MSAPHLPHPDIPDPGLGQVQPQRAKRLQVSRYDQVSAGLIAALMLAATLVLMLFIVWLSTRVWTRPLAVEPQLIEPLSGGGNAMGTARELVEPGEEEIEDILEPELEETLDAVTDAVSTQQATLESLGGEALSSTRGGGAGDSRQPGPGDGDSELIPRSARWQVHFASANLDGYARQLDFFGIELAAVGGSKATIDYASGFSTGVQRREGEPGSETRMYLTWRYGPLRNADISLLQRAGIETENRILMQFLPPETENRLALVEKQYCDEQQRTLRQVRTTVFKVRQASGRFEFYVDEQITR